MGFIKGYVSWNCLFVGRGGCGVGEEGWGCGVQGGMCLGWWALWSAGRVVVLGLGREGCEGAVGGVESKVVLLFLGGAGVWRGVAHCKAVDHSCPLR